VKERRHQRSKGERYAREALTGAKVIVDLLDILVEHVEALLLVTTE